MDLQTIVYIIIGLGFILLVAFLFLIEDAFGRLVDWLFSLIGFSSGNGPLVVIAERNGDMLKLTMQNLGSTKLKLAAIEGRDCSNQQHFPKPYLVSDDPKKISTEEIALRRFSKIIVNPQESQVVNLAVTDLQGFGCSSLAILDANGKSWSVEGFHADELI